MMYSTRKELADAVIGEYNRAVKGQVEQLYYCKAWIFMPGKSDSAKLFYHCSGFSALHRHFVGV